MATTQVILTEKIEGLGFEADIVTVKRGYARNFLIPYGKAFEATKSNLRHTEALKAKRAAREAEELGQAEKTAAALKKLNLKMTLKTGETGKAFGAITASDIAKAVEEQGGGTIDRHNIELDKNIKKTGKMTVEVKLHPEVSATLRLDVATETAEKEEASEGR